MLVLAEPLPASLALSLPSHSNFLLPLYPLALGKCHLLGTNLLAIALAASFSDGIKVHEKLLKNELGSFKAPPNQNLNPLFNSFSTIIKLIVNTSYQKIFLNKRRFEAAVEEVFFYTQHAVLYYKTY